jgi:hypothetical protein
VSVTTVMDAEFVLGADALPAGRQREIQRFLTGVIERRQVPLHLNCLWNALYYRFDLDSGTYPLDALNIDLLSEVTLGRVGPALPVGAFTLLPTTTDAQDLVGEVAAKSGWHPSVTAGQDGFANVPPDLAGGNATTARLHERVVVDFDVLAGWNQITAAQLRRIAERGVWLDDLGHLVYDADYPTVESAELDDTSFYIEWLLTHRRSGLLDWAFDLPEGVTLEPDELDRAVAATFHTVERLLDTSPNLVRWGDYFWTEAALDAYLGGAERDGAGPLNRGELDQLARMVSHTYRQSVRYVAVAAEIDHPRLDPDHRHETLNGIRWVAATVATNLYLTRQLTSRAIDGIVATADGDVHVRLDDRWQHGGLWRTEPADELDRLWYRQLPIDRPLGLGAGRDLPADEPEVSPAATAQTGAEELLDTEALWSVVLSTEALIGGTLPIPAEIARRMPRGPVAVRLTHRVGPVGVGDLLTRTWRTRWRGDAEHLDGLAWPATLPIGTVLHCRLPYSGQVVDVETRQLDVPKTVGDLDLTHEHDLDVVRNAAVRQPRRQQQRRLADRATAVFDSLAPAADGSARIALTSLCQLLFGPDATADPSRIAATLQIADELGLDRRDGLLVRTGGGFPVGRKVASLDEATRGHLQQVVRRRAQRMRLAPLEPGQAPPSNEEYTSDRAGSGETATLPERLPAGYTYVRPIRVQGPTSQHALGIGEGEVDYYGAGKDWD